MDLKANTSKIPFMQIIKGILPIGMGTYSLRDKNLNWSKVVDGTTSTTQWKGLHEVSETVHSITLLMVGCKIAIPHPIQLLVLKVRKRRTIYLIWHRMEKV
jgi:hypothetical protein